MIIRPDTITVEETNRDKDEKGGGRWIDNHEREKKRPRDKEAACK